jgi:site-specific DNA recombinase
VIRVREDTLLDAVHDFFANRIFGPQRRTLIEAGLPETDKRSEDDWHTRCSALRTSIEGIRRRQTRLIDQFDDPDNSEPDIDDETERELTRQLKARFAELETERRGKTADLETLEANPPRRDHQTSLLDRLPHLQRRLAELPERLQRQLFDVFHLEIHYDAHEHTATIRVTMSEDTIDGIAHTSGQLIGPQTPENDSQSSPTTKPTIHPVADLVRAPCRIRTCAPGSGGRCSIP